MLRAYFWKLDHQVVRVYLKSAEQSWLWNIYKDKRYIHASFSCSDQSYMLFYPAGGICFFILQTTWRCRFSFYLPGEYCSLFSCMSSQSGNAVCANSFRQDDHEICSLVSREAGWIWIEYSNEFLSLSDRRALVLICKPLFFFFINLLR